MPHEPSISADDDADAFRRYLTALAPNSANGVSGNRGAVIDGPGKKPSPELLAFFAFIRGRDDGTVSFRQLLIEARSIYPKSLPCEVVPDDWQSEIASNDPALSKMRGRYRRYVARTLAGLPGDFVFSETSTRLLIIGGWLDELCMFWQHASISERRTILRHLSAK